MAATATLLELVDSGSHVVAMDDLYGGSFRLFERVRRRSAGLDFTFADLSDPKAAAGAIRPDTRMIWIETPTNPLLKLVDIAAVAEAARGRGILVVVDNTFATPWIQRPLELGADIVMHSATKFLNGHSDMVGGVAVVGDAGLAERLAYLQNAIGAVGGPFDSFLALRGLKTLPLRMRQSSESALAIASWLEKHPGVERVLYPGLPSHPQHALARRQMGRGGSGVVTFFLKGGLAEALGEDARPKQARMLDAKQQAAIVAMICAPPPPGRSRWTLMLIVEEATRRKIVAKVGRETIRRMLTRHELKPWREKNVVRPEAGR
jgi:cystathionine gamma-lyase